VNYRVLPEADGEAIAAALWYDDKHAGLGDEFLLELQAAFATIHSDPLSMPILETYFGPHSIRRQLLKRFPYFVVVLCREQELLIVAVAHSRRHPLYWLERLE
jgi:toxin ParE1/3/4